MVELAEEIQIYADTNRKHKLYSALKQVDDLTTSTTAPVKSRDGTALDKGDEAISRHWVEIYCYLLNGGVSSDHSVLIELRQSTSNNQWTVHLL